jgi:nucleoside-diphosphate-sugar epimerase
MAEGGAGRQVLVTGASGYIATHIVKMLLDKGMRVVGTVRSLKDESRIAHLRALDGASERLQLLEAALTAAGAFDEACKGCEVGACSYSKGTA